MLFAAQPAIAAPDPSAAISEAWGAHYAGRTLTARRGLERALADPAAQGPAVRTPLLETLLDICIAGRADGCVVEHMADYLATYPKLAQPDEAHAREQMRRAAYYLDHGKLAVGAPDVTAVLMDSPIWRRENAFNRELYLRRQRLALRIQLETGDAAGALRSVDKIFSLLAALTNPQEGRLAFAEATADAIAGLTAMGETDRAFGLYKAAGETVVAALPPLSVEAAQFRLTEARLLLARLDLEGAERALLHAVSLSAAIELEDEVRQAMQAEALSSLAFACLARGQEDCARNALARHPFATLYAKPGRKALAHGEVAYLAARALVGAADPKGDPVALAALASSTAGEETAETAIFRAFGAALAQPQGDRRAAGLSSAGKLLADRAAAPSTGVFAGWYQPGALDQTLVALALTQAGADSPSADDTIFTLFQLAGRRGATFDTDALTLLGQAKDGLQRRSVHQALRLRARRDAYERAEIQKVAAQALANGSAAPLRHDLDRRSVLRDFSDRIGRAEQGLAEAGVATGGAGAVSLATFQAVLRPHEAALSVSGTAGGLAYLCVRRDRVQRKVVGAEGLDQARIDARLVKAALTAGHAPNETLDSQFPVAAAVRLHDLLIKPFEGCISPGDHILWLPNASITGLPLAALLERPPERLQTGFDLSTAAWLVRRHAVSYVGSAGALAAARTEGRLQSADFDFLGVGDPVFSGAAPGGTDRARLATRGVAPASGVTTLAALPETRAELEQSARPFRTARLLTGEAASEGSVRAQALSAYRYLSFATHGLVREDLQGLSEPALALTPVSAADAADDGLLTAGEIADLNLLARFVALSACNTANFDLDLMARELPALASAFAVAGVPATLGTLWPVESETGRRVVAPIFAHIAAAGAPAEALAEAQRAFLADPPSRAYLHPRFWAPFILLGDGGATPEAAQPDLRLADIHTLDEASNAEVVALSRDGERILARLASDEGAAVQVASEAGEALWSSTNRKVAGGRFIATLGPVILAGGASGERTARPALEAFDARTGARRGIWTGDTLAAGDSYFAAGTRLGEEAAAFVVADLGGASGVAVRVFETQASLQPRLLFETAPQGVASLDEATLTAWGDDLLLTYSERHTRTATGLSEDDFENRPCLGPPITWVELRDRGTGVLKASRRLEGWMVAAAVVHGDRLILAGARRDGCVEEFQASAAGLDRSLDLEPLYLDRSLGASEVRAMTPLGDGRILLAARKENLLDYRATGSGADKTYSGLALTLDAAGKASAAKLIDSGGDLFLFAAAPGSPGQAYVGGAMGGAATLFRLEAP
jgi:CHAT domain-containing protein